jgi:hypothetical protein
MNKPILTTFAAALLTLSAGALAQSGTQGSTRAAEPIFGSQLMTQQERNEYRGRMRAAKTDEERAAIRAEHHQQMVERAKERGQNLPPEPPAQRGMMRGGMGGGGMGGGGMGGSGMGGGMGHGRMQGGMGDCPGTGPCARQAAAAAAPKDDGAKPAPQ